MQNKTSLKAVCKARLITIKAQVLTIALLLQRDRTELLTRLDSLDPDKLYSIQELREIFT